MAKKAFEKIMAGLEDAVAYADGDRFKGVAHRVKIRDVDGVSDLKKYVTERIKKDKAFDEGYEDGYVQFLEKVTGDLDVPDEGH